MLISQYEHKEEIIEFLKQNRGLLSQRYHVARIGLFGSFARGEQTERSVLICLSIWMTMSRMFMTQKTPSKSFFVRLFWQGCGYSQREVSKAVRKRAYTQRRTLCLAIF